ncbi:chalcone isomerase family protein [Desulfosarcina sp.]|uniref:chalcone isomerase family protein n=1 Tax=Desulfosarcina sp. TaxID=2027861 RepID=UPI003970997F
MTIIRWLTKPVAYILTLTMLIAPTAGGTEVGRVFFDKQVVVGSQLLEIRGTGILRYMRFIKAYAGALYTLPGLDPGKVLADTPKRLEVAYFYALKGKDFGPATYKGLARNLDAPEIERLRPRIDHHNSLYVNVEPGDRYALTYIPGIGTELALNGRRLGVIEGADFAAAIFSLWLGENPFDAQFKNELLGLDG